MFLQINTCQTPRAGDVKMRTWQLVFVGVAIHTVFFYSIFDIYFTSPIVHGMSPHKSPVGPPAKRLVLFSADGLRADKLFELEDGKPRIPYLRNIMETTGAWGVSHTRVPTESRPGHVAMIAGIYEDVSAVAKGWKENPVEFDSVFNETRYTWSWGSPDILPMFSKGATGDHVFTKCYPASFEDFASSDHSNLDTWVFDEVKDFFANVDSSLKEKLQQNQIIFFMHLLGLDTNGHSKKPYSREYLENIQLVDKGIQETVKLIESYYKQDGQTAYILTADHGMTDWGSHGAGHPSETLTPLIAWGAGVRGPVKERSMGQYQDTFSTDWQLGHLRRTDIEQADVAPLMTALIGTNYPLNSVGLLPYDYLDMTVYGTAEAMFANSRQILEQYQVKMEMKKSTTLSFAFRPFKELTASDLVANHRHIQNLIHTGQYKEAIQESEELIKVALRGLNYYQTYDRLFLGASVASGFIGWMVYILTLVFEKHSGIVHPRVRLEQQRDEPFWRTNTGIIVIFSLIGTLIAVLLFVQSLPWTNYLYCLIPVILWMVVCLRFDMLRQVYEYMRVMKNLSNSVAPVLACFVGLEIIVLGFFYREMFSLGLALMSTLPFISTDLKAVDKRPLVLWSVSCMLLSVFPLMPVVTGKRNIIYVILGGITVIVGSLHKWTRSSPFLASLFRSKSLAVVITGLQEQNTDSQKDKPLFLLQVFLVCIATYFSGFAVQSGMSTWQHVLSWLVLGFSFVAPLLGSTSLPQRLLAIFLAFTSPFVLLSVSYEVLFLVMLCMLLQQWINLECSLYRKIGEPTAQYTTSNMLDTLDFGHSSTALDEKSRSYLVMQDIQQAFYFIFLILTAFFGTGNIASINSFDPACVLCFVSVFSPFVMGALLLFKVLVPFILVTCTLQAIHLVTKVPIQGLFLLILLMSDCMALNFFFLVQDYGSWLDIGTSISHYVIVMTMIIFIMLLFGVSHILTRVRLRMGQY